MSEKNIARIAVLAATFWVDRPYDYKIPEEFAEKLRPGMRVIVPFALGNRRTEGIVLALAETSKFKNLKNIASVLDDTPVITEEQVKLALWMRERFFCTVYEAVKAMLPAGLWFRDEKPRVRDKTVLMCSLEIPTEEAVIVAAQKKKSAPAQAAILETLCAVGWASVRELSGFTGASRTSIRRLEELGYVSTEPMEVFRRPERRIPEPMPLPELTDDQERIFAGILGLAKIDKAEAALLFGITGSGKTAIYIWLIDAMLRRGKSAILLVPEIALTPQMLLIFSSHFGDDIAVLHSSLTLVERYDEWKRIKNGTAKLVIGTRSAVFAPCENLGIIIMDEEQEQSYKSENNPRYHARDIAKYRCARSDALLLLGSATPDVESRYAAEIGKYAYFELNERYNEQDLPAVELVDMKRELRHGNTGNISSVLLAELRENLLRGEQSILFLNRRGTYRLLTCADCGFTYSCPHCSVSLTYHGSGSRLVCHYCGYSQKPSDECPECAGAIVPVGAGTQLIEEELHARLPGVEVLRMDTDTVKVAGSHNTLLERFERRNIPIMVGTQMVAKGLNLSRVTLVGVISADQALYTGDYRAAERTFSLLTQVIGRSGRGERLGRAVIQTYTPDNETILLAGQQDYERFYAAEIVLRKLLNNPPFSDIFAVTATGENEQAVLSACVAIRDMLMSAMKGREDAFVLGPAPFYVVRVMRRFRYRVLLECTADRETRAVIADIVCHCNTNKAFKGVSVFADCNPSE